MVTLSGQSGTPGQSIKWRVRNHGNVSWNKINFPFTAPPYSNQHTDCFKKWLQQSQPHCLLQSLGLPFLKRRCGAIHWTAQGALMHLEGRGQGQCWRLRGCCRCGGQSEVRAHVPSLLVNGQVTGTSHRSPPPLRGDATRGECCPQPGPDEGLAFTDKQELYWAPASGNPQCPAPGSKSSI